MKTAIKISIIMLFCLLANNEMQANSKPVKCVDNQSVNIIANNQNSIINAEVVKDGKWRERWNQFLEGFLDGFKDGVNSISNPNGNTNSPGLSKEDLAYLSKHSAQLGSKASAIDMFNQFDELINDESPIITNKQMLQVFRGNDKILNIIKKSMENSTFPKESTVKNIDVRAKSEVLQTSRIERPSNSNTEKGISNNDIFIDKEKAPMKIWRVLGYVVGWIVGNIVKG